MFGDPVLRAARRRWQEREAEEELALYEFVLEETPNSPGDGM
jgi:hypothetical protein